MKDPSGGERNSDEGPEPKQGQEGRVLYHPPTFAWRMWYSVLARLFSSLFFSYALSLCFCFCSLLSMASKIMRSAISTA